MIAVKFECTTEENLLIKSIVNRASEKEKLFDGKNKEQYTSSLMDITACHCNGCELDLKNFLEADSFNFAHDFIGIL
jgi:hypothetical protein